MSLRVQSEHFRSEISKPSHLPVSTGSLWFLVLNLNNIKFLRQENKIAFKCIFVFKRKIRSGFRRLGCLAMPFLSVLINEHIFLRIYLMD